MTRGYFVHGVDMILQEKRWDDWPSPVLGSRRVGGHGESASRRVGYPSTRVKALNPMEGLGLHVRGRESVSSRRSSYPSLLNPCPMIALKAVHQLGRVALYR